MINLVKLAGELRAASLLVDGCSSDGSVQFTGTPTTEQRTLAAQIVAAHDPTPPYDELRRKEYPTTDELIVALWERIVEGRNEASDTLQAKREVIKAKYPKP